MAGAGTRTILSGGGFGDNLMSVLPDVIGNTIGNVVAGEVHAAIDKSRTEKLASSELLPEDLRGSDAARELTRDLIATGASDANVREALASDQMIAVLREIQAISTGTAKVSGEASLDRVQVADASGVFGPNGTMVPRGEGKGIGESVYDVLTSPFGRGERVGVETAADKARAYVSARLAAAVYDPEIGTVLGFKRMDPRQYGLNPGELLDKASGFKADIFSNGRETVVAFAGTDLGSSRDWLTNAANGLGLKTPQYTTARRIGRLVDARVGAGSLSFVGHSLGGGLAAFASMSTGRNAITFNAAGVHPAILKSFGYSRGDQGLRVLNYSHHGDILSNLQSMPLMVEAMGRQIHVGSVSAHLVAGGAAGVYYHTTSPLLEALKNR